MIYNPDFDEDEKYYKYVLSREFRVKKEEHKDGWIRYQPQIKWKKRKKPEYPLYKDEYYDREWIAIDGHFDSRHYGDFSKARYKVISYEDSISFIFIKEEQALDCIEHFKLYFQAKLDKLPEERKKHEEYLKLEKQRKEELKKWTKENEPTVTYKSIGNKPGEPETRKTYPEATKGCLPVIILIIITCTILI